MLQIERAKSGEPTASSGGRRIHSRFDPDREAASFVQSLFPRIPGTLLLIGPGLGYIGRHVARTVPRCHLVSFFLSSETYDARVFTAGDSWSPDCGESVTDFCARVLVPLESVSIDLVEWEPATQSYPGVADRVRKELGTALHRLQASLVTEGGSGRRWFRNAMSNYMHTVPVIPAAGDRQVAACVIAASGPSLEESLRWVRKARDRVFLLALGSSLSALSNVGVVPDAVITSDSSPYATHYLRPLLTLKNPPPVIAPLSASRGIHSAFPVVPLGQGDAVEDALADTERHPGLYSPSAGTVTASALMVAASLSQWPIILAGLDLAWRDGVAHARPHLSQAYALSGTSRVRTLTSLTFGQTVDMNRVGESWFQDRSLATYESWFLNVSLKRYPQASRICPAPTLRGYPEFVVRILDSEDCLFRAPVFVPSPWPGPTARREKMRRFLDSSRRALESLGSNGTGHSISQVAQGSPLGTSLLLRLAPVPSIAWAREPGEGSLLNHALSVAMRELELGGEQSV